MGNSEFFDNKGPESPPELEEVVGLPDPILGGLGSSCSSLILGGDRDGGERRDDAFGDEDCGFKSCGPDRGCGSSEVERGPLTGNPGFNERELLLKGPEKACLFIFL